MTYEYFTNLDIEHIDVDTISKGFAISEFQRGMEFFKTINEDISFVSDETVFLKIGEDVSDLQELDISYSFEKDIVESESISVSQLLEFERSLIEEIQFSEFCRGIEFNKAIDYDETIVLNSLLKSISDITLKDICTSVYSGVTELSLSDNLTPSFELSNFLKFIKRKTLTDSVIELSKLFGLNINKIIFPSSVSEFDYSYENTENLNLIKEFTSTFSISSTLPIIKKKSFDFNYKIYDTDILKIDNYEINDYNVLTDILLIGNSKLDFEYQVDLLLSDLLNDSYTVLYIPLLPIKLFAITGKRIAMDITGKRISMKIESKKMNMDIVANEFE